MPTQEKLPKTRQSITHSFQIGETDGYITVSRYPDGRIGEIQARVDRVGSTVNGLIDAACIVASTAIQHGVPLWKVIDVLRHQKYAPSGTTNNPQIPVCSSFSDYLGQLLVLVEEDQLGRNDVH